MPYAALADHQRGLLQSCRHDPSDECGEVLAVGSHVVIVHRRPQAYRLLAVNQGIVSVLV